MIRPCSTYDSTLFDSWFDPLRLMIRPCSTHDYNLLDSIDPVRLMIRSCSTRDSTLFDSWLDPVWLYRPCSTHDSTLFDYSVCSTVLVCDKNWNPFDRAGRIMSRTLQPAVFSRKGYLLEVVRILWSKIWAVFLDNFAQNLASKWAVWAVFKRFKKRSNTAQDLNDFSAVYLRNRSKPFKSCAAFERFTKTNRSKTAQTAHF